MAGFLERYDAASDADKARFLMGAVKADPDGVFAELRARRPVLLTPPPRQIALVTRMADVRDVLERWTVFTVRPYAPRMDPVVGPFMLARDDDEINQRDKGLMLAVLSRRDLPAVRDAVGRLATAAIDEVRDAGRLEVVGGLGRGVPLRLCGTYFGFAGSGQGVDDLARWSRATQHDMFHNLQGNDPAVHEANLAAGREMRAHVGGLIAATREALALDPMRDDVLARLVKLRPAPGLGFDEERVAANVMGLLVGMVETSSAAVVQALDQLLSRPDALADAALAARREDHEAVARHVWEALRFDPINPFVARLSVAPYVVGAGTAHATAIPAGTLTLAATRSAMRDEAALAEPEAYRTDRPGHAYLHLGYGPHACLGAQVSLVQVPEIVRQILLLPGLRRAEGEAGRIDFRGGPFPERFCVAFDNRDGGAI